MDYLIPKTEKECAADLKEAMMKMQLLLGYYCLMYTDTQKEATAKVVAAVAEVAALLEIGTHLVVLKAYEGQASPKEGTEACDESRKTQMH